MLRFLGIQNLAVIERLELEFSPGLTVLTGETGAGKSILVEAINLLVGGRASPDLVRTGEDATSVQAVFETPDGGELIARREVTAQGRSRAFLDGVLTTAAALREQVLPLIDLHGQHEHQALLDPDTHLDVLDAYARISTVRGPRSEVRSPGLTSRLRVADGDNQASGQSDDAPISPRQELAAAFDDMRRLREELDRARRDERERLTRTDLLAFQLQEIGRAALKPGEDDQLASTKRVLASADKVQRLCAESYAALYESDTAALATLGSVWRRVADLAAIDPVFAPYLEARDAIKSQLEDLAGVFRDYAATLDASPARLQEVEDRLALVERLKRKYGPTLDDVLAKEAAVREELDTLERAGERASELEPMVACAREKFLQLARAVSAKRRQAAGRLARDLEREVRALAMEHTRFEVRFEPELPESRWTERGIDAAEFYLSPNPGEELRALARIASGGELSRVMLALKTLASTDAPGKTLVFDEVDAGIGGRVADAVGSRLQVLGRDYQIFCITHLPQIAAYASSHFRVSKGVEANRTTTRVDGLKSRGDRIEELARMIGGSKVSAATLANAGEMLDGRLEAKREAKAKGESERSRAKAKD